MVAREQGGTSVLPATEPEPECPMLPSRFAIVGRRARRSGEDACDDGLRPSFSPRGPPSQCA